MVLSINQLYKVFDSYRCFCFSFKQNPQQYKIMLSKGIPDVSALKETAYSFLTDKHELEYLELMVDMLKNYLSGTYKEIPSRSIYAILAGFIYLVAPIDAIPDTIPIAGLGDDAAVIKAVIDYILKDIETFRQWKIRHA